MFPQTVVDIFFSGDQEIVGRAIKAQTSKKEAVLFLTQCLRIALDGWGEMGCQAIIAQIEKEGCHVETARA